MATLTAKAPIEIRSGATIHKLKDIALDVSWSKISTDYFGKSSSWMYNKLKGRDGNGGEGGFTESETQELKDALLQLSARIRLAAESL